MRYRELALALEDGGEVLTVDETHGDVLDAIDLAQVMNAHDVLVSHLTGEQQFTLESLIELGSHLRVGTDLRADYLERHQDPQDDVPSLIDSAHSPQTEQLDDVVALAEFLAELQGTAVSLRRRDSTGAGVELGDIVILTRIQERR